MERTLTGFKQTGSWHDIVEHGERITAALVELDVTNEEFEEWNTWRPKANDRLDDDISTKTAEKASINKGKGEQQDKAPNEDLKKAGKKLSDSGASSSSKEAASDIHDSVSYAIRAADTAGRKALRAVENSVYKHLMTKMSPYYFDNEIISANATRTTELGSKNPEFVLEININNDQLRNDLIAVLDDFEDVNRWHMETEKNTETAEQVEGQDAPKEQGGIAHSVTQVSEPKEEHKDQLHEQE